MIRSLPHTEPAERIPTSTEEPFLTLDQLARTGVTEPVVIEDVIAVPALRRRLLEAGFTAGSTVRFVMATPFGDPLVFSLRGASLALRKSEACCVQVRR